MCACVRVSMFPYVWACMRARVCMTVCVPLAKRKEIEANKQSDGISDPLTEGKKTNTAQ